MVDNAKQISRHITIVSWLNKLNGGNRFFSQNLVGPTVPWLPEQRGPFNILSNSREHWKLII